MIMPETIFQSKHIESLDLKIRGKEVERKDLLFLLPKTFHVCFFFPWGHFLSCLCQGLNTYQFEESLKFTPNSLLCLSVLSPPPSLSVCVYI